MDDFAFKQIYEMLKSNFPAGFFAKWSKLIQTTVSINISRITELLFVQFCNVNWRMLWNSPTWERILRFVPTPKKLDDFSEEMKLL